MKSTTTSSREPLILFIATLVALGISAIHPHDYPTWLMEVAPVLIGLPILIVSYRRFRLTQFVYRLLFLHSLILMVGGHYTYAEVPLGFWMKDALGFARNHFDRIGHFTQGFVPAILTREILLRRSPLVQGKWLSFLVVCVCMTISVCYEFLEWWSAVIGGEAADAFLGTQGDVWDTQWDMFLCFIGASVSLALFSRMHDRYLQALEVWGKPDPVS